MQKISYKKPLFLNRLILNTITFTLPFFFYGSSFSSERRVTFDTPKSNIKLYPNLKDLEETRILSDFAYPNSTEKYLDGLEPIDTPPSREDEWDEQTEFLDKITSEKLAPFFKNMEIGTDQLGIPCSQAFYKHYVLHSKEAETSDATLPCLTSLRQINSETQFKRIPTSSNSGRTHFHYQIAFYLAYPPSSPSKTQRDKIHLLWIEAYNPTKLIEPMEKDLILLRNQNIVRSKLEKYLEKTRTDPDLIIPKESDLVPNLNVNSLPRPTITTTTQRKDISPFVQSCPDLPTGSKVVTAKDVSPLYSSAQDLPFERKKEHEERKTFARPRSKSSIKSDSEILSEGKTDPDRTIHTRPRSKSSNKNQSLSISNFSDSDSSTNKEEIPISQREAPKNSPKRKNSTSPRDKQQLIQIHTSTRRTSSPRDDLTRSNSEPGSTNSSPRPLSTPKSRVQSATSREPSPRTPTSLSTNNSAKSSPRETEENVYELNVRIKPGQEMPFIDLSHFPPNYKIVIVPVIDLPVIVEDTYQPEDEIMIEGDKEKS